MTVLLKTAKSVTQSREKADSGLNADEINEFNLQSNKERKKVRMSDMYCNRYCRNIRLRDMYCNRYCRKNKTDVALSLLVLEF